MLPHLRHLPHPARARNRSAAPARGIHARLGALAGLILLCAAAGGAAAAGFEMFAAASFSTGEKPQSKLWYHDGSYWAVLDGPDGVALYEKTGTTWVRGSYADAILVSSGTCDVKWDGHTLFVLVYASTSRLFEYEYDAAFRIWVRKPGFPVTLPNPAGSETMVLEEDSTGRLWTAVEGGTSINVYYTTSADHRTWSTTPVVLQTGVSADDICSIVAFGNGNVGVFWSDQVRDEFGFRVHHDGDAPTAWTAKEIPDAGPGHADDHINLAFDSLGRVYAITKDDFDNMRVHRRSTTGIWTTKTNVIAGDGTRGIVMVAEADAKVYILFTRWGVTPHRIEYRAANIETLDFGGTTTFISSTSDMNNVTGMKQILPPASLIAVAENGSRCLYNSFGAPPGGAPAPPTPPRSPAAVLASGPVRVLLSWLAPASGVPDGYHVYRAVNGAPSERINGAIVSGTSFTDSLPPPAQLCYEIRAVQNALQSSPSAAACVDNTPPAPPGAPGNVMALLGGTQVRAVQLAWQAPASGDPAVSYDIDRSVDAGPYVRLNAAPVAGLAFADSAPVQGGLCYAVSAVSAAGLRGPASTPVCVTVGAPPPLPPDSVQVALDTADHAAMVRWVASAAGSPAVAFNVYRTTDGGPPLRLNAAPIADHPSLQFWIDDAPPTGIVCYQVAGVDAAGYEGAPSAVACVPLLPPPPQEPQAALAEPTLLPGGVAGTAAWTFDAGAGQTAADATGHGHTLVLGATPATETTDPGFNTGVSGLALTFDGIDDRAVVADAPDLDFAGSFTLEGWFQRAAGGSADCILSKGDTQNRNYYVLIDATNHIVFRWETAGGTNHGTTTAATVSDTAWHHVACVYDAALQEDRIYLDGVLVRRAGDNGVPLVNASPIDIGMRRSGSPADFFAGSIDQVRVTNAAVYTADFTPPHDFPAPDARPAAHLAWETPASGNPTGYVVYRQLNGGPLTRITATPLTAQSFLDADAPLGQVCYRVSALDAYGQEGPMSAPLCVRLPAAAPSDAGATPPAAALTLVAGPNPFNPTVRIEYTLAAAGEASLRIFDARGTRVRTLFQGARPAGPAAVTWDGKSDHGNPVASGIYFVVLRDRRTGLTRKLTLLR